MNITLKKTTNMEKVIKTSMMVAVLLIFAVSCKKEPTNSGGSGNNNNPSTPPEQYILMNGLKVKIKNPANGYISLSSGDTLLTWAGNQPSSVIGDSVVIIRHMEGVKRGVNIVDRAPFEYGEVGIQIFYGATDAKTNLYVESGEYKLEKVNGIWYSVLKNGAGEATKGTSTLNLTGVEFRLAWPSTFQ